MAMNLTTQASLLDTIKDVMSYKGTKATYQEILDLTDMVKGDIWGCTEVGHLGFFLYNGTDWELFGSDSTKAVTLDSEQTIVGNKFFQTDEAATSYVRLYPKPTPINGINYIGHLSGNFLVGDAGNDRLNICIPTANSIGFTSPDGNTRGGVYFEESSETSGFGVNINSGITSSTNSNFYGSGFSRIMGVSQETAFIGVGTITDDNSYGAFIASSFKLGINLTSDTSTLEINDKAKSEFKRVLEIPNLTTGFEMAGALTCQSTVNLNSDTNVSGPIFFTNNIEINDTSTGGLTIQPAANSITINLDDSATLTLSAKMISELKRILGIS